jgi:hypothetical protein
VQLEYQLIDLLTCELYSTKGYGNFMVEIETGFIPPEYAPCPLTYTSVRLASKIIRYSSSAGKFALGMSFHYILPFPRALVRLPRKRMSGGIAAPKNFCNRYYQNLPVKEEEICDARIQEIYIIDVDRAKVREIAPETYMKRAFHSGILSDYADS